MFAMTVHTRAYYLAAKSLEKEFLLLVTCAVVVVIGNDKGILHCKALRITVSSHTHQKNGVKPYNVSSLMSLACR